MKEPSKSDIRIPGSVKQSEFLTLEMNAENLFKARIIVLLKVS